MKKTWFLLLSVLGLLLFVASQKCVAQSLRPGTEIKVRLLDRLNTGETQAGQTFSATIAEPVRSGGHTIFVKNAKVRGQVIEVVSSGRLKRPASISLQLTRVGRTAVHTEVLQIDGKSHAKRDTALIGGGAAVGVCACGLRGASAVLGAACLGPPPLARPSAGPAWLCPTGPVRLRRTWPISPATPREPRYGRPPRRSPAPMPAETRT